MNGLIRGGAVAALASALTLALAGSAFAAKPQSAGGSFVIGDQNAAVGSTVYFWGAQWWQSNGLSGGAAPASFKGFADTATGACGEQWSTRPGDSSQPPLSVGDVIPVVVAGTVAKDGPVISGDTTEVVLVRVDPGYGPAPGHVGTGTVVSVLCGGGSDNGGGGNGGGGVGGGGGTPT